MLLLSLLLVAGMVASATASLAAPPTSDNNGNPTKFIGETGFDSWGYNYNARMFSGGYCDSYRDAGWCQEYADIKLIMKWNDAWLSNLDRDDSARDPSVWEEPPTALDLGLDRHYGFDSYIGSGAWITNHQAGEYTDDDGNVCKWTYFVKIVAVPTDATATGGIWYTADGTEIGPVIWGSFAVIQEVENDKCAGIHGAQYVSPFSAGFGAYSPIG